MYLFSPRRFLVSIIVRTGVKYRSKVKALVNCLNILIAYDMNILNVRFLPLGNENRSSISSSICGRVDDVLLSTPSSSNSALLDFNQTTLPELDNAEDKPDLLQLIVDEEIKQFF